MFLIQTQDYRAFSQASAGNLFLLLGLQSRLFTTASHALVTEQQSLRIKQGFAENRSLRGSACAESFKTKQTTKAKEKKNQNTKKNEHANEISSCLYYLFLLSSKAHMSWRGQNGVILKN